MQILERPVEPQVSELPRPITASPAQTHSFREGDGNGHRSTRAVATSVDDLEEAFQRKKRKELEPARLAGSGDRQQVQQVVRGEKIGRNDPCPCGSGKKYKKCCGAKG